MHSLLLVVFLTQPSQPPTPSPSESGQKQQAVASSENGNAAVSPQVSPSVTPSPTSTPPAQTKGNPTPDKNDQPPADWIELASGLSNVVIAGVTIALLVVAAMEWNLNRATLALSVATERAWVNIERLSIELEVGKPPIITVGIKNSGNSPAFVVTSRGQIGVYGPDEELEDEPDMFGSSTDLGELFLVPNQVITGVTSLFPDVINADYAGIVDGSKRLYIYGLIEYRDTLSKDVHTTTWGRQLNPKGSQEKPLSKFLHIHKAAYNRAT